MKIQFRNIVLFGLAMLFSSSAATRREEWIPLLDKNLSKWGMYLAFSHKNGYHGEVPVDEKGNAREPVGYNNNTAGVFTVSEEDGEPILRVSGEIYGCIFTKQEYENYRLKLKVKWGEKKWEPRLEKLRDTGICYHSIGDCGADYWRAWMLSQEFQLMEGHFGDFWNIGPTAIDIRAYLPEGKMNPVANAAQPLVSVGAGTENDGFCLRSENRENPKGEWTEVELICFEGKSLHIVNGKVVMVLQNSRYQDNGKIIPLTRGKIQLQSEAAEVYYKDIVIKEINSLPADFVHYFQNTGKSKN